MLNHCIAGRFLKILPFQYYCILFLIMGFIVYLPMVQAGNIRIKPVLELNEVYTDNVKYTSNNKNDDLISVITPGIRLTSESRRIRTDIFYNLQNIIYANSDKTQFLHQLSVKNNTELFPSHLFFDASIRNSQQNVGNTGHRSFDNYSLSTDRENVFSYQLSPYWKQRLKNFADVELRYTRNEIDSKRNDSKSNKYKFKANSGSNFTRLLWGLDYNYEDINRKNISDIRLSTLKGTLKYLITNQIALVGDFGYDDNKYASSTGISGRLWDVGFEWNPSRRTDLTLKYGERYFGSNILADLSYKSKRSRISIKYSEEPYTERTRLLEQQAFNLVDPFGSDITNPSVTDIANLDVTGTNRFAEVIIRKSFQFTGAYNFRKSTLLLQLKKSDREFQLTSRKESEDTYRLNWTWNGSRKTNINLDLLWIDDESLLVKDQRYIVSQLGLTRKLTSLLDFNIGMRYIDVNSNNSNFEYNEFRINAGLNKRF